ncbi:hypothetical protein RhiirC2_785301, partial [Rhizophagus irregularis]
SIIGESSYHKSTELNSPLQVPQVTNKSAKLNSLSQLLPVASPVANKSDELNVPPVANENNELNSPSQALPIANKSANNESTKLNLSIQAPLIAVPKKKKVPDAEVFVVVETQTSKMKTLVESQALVSEVSE